MANRSTAPAHRKMLPQFSIQQQRRARQMLALVPKPGAKLDLDESESSEDEYQNNTHQMHSDSSSPPPSLPSSIENLNLLSDDDIEVNEVIASTSLVAYQQSTSKPYSPSIPSPSLITTEIALLRPIPSPLSPSILGNSPQAPSPRVYNLKRRYQSPPPSPHFVHSPSTSTRSKKPKLVTVKRKVIPPKRLEPKWGRFKFTGYAELDDSVSGMVYDFLIYGGDDTFRFHSFSDEENSMGLGAKVVLALAKSIQQPACKLMCFDNFFTSIELLQYLRNERGIFSIGTIRGNRLRGAENKLPTDKNLKKKGRGSYAQVVCNKSKIAVVKWFDNKCVTAASTCVDAYPTQTVVRYKKEEGRKIPVSCPNLIKEYNTNMGGVDLADMLIALYRTPFRGHRWYLPIFSQMLDICINNAWLLYRRHRKTGMNVGKRKSLKNFRLEIFESLRKCERSDTVDISGPSMRATKIVHKPVAVRPPDSVRYDQLAHYPAIVPNRGRCMYCTKGLTNFFCKKCKLRLCLLPERNCFIEYHTK